MRLCLLSFVSLMASVYCLLGNSSAMYEYIFLLPLTYSVVSALFFITLKSKRTYRLNVIFYLSNILVFIRYVVTPFFTVYSDGLVSWGWGPDPSSQAMLQAIVLMCLEEIAVFLTQSVAIRHYSRMIPDASRHHDIDAHGEHLAVIGVYALLAFLLVLAVKPSQIMPADVNSDAVQTVAVRQAEDTAGSGLFVILGDTSKILLFCVLLILCKRAYDQRHSGFFVMLAIVVVLLNVYFNISVTRMRMVFAVIIGLYFLNLLFKKIPKIVYILAITICAIGFINISLFKFSYALHGSNDLQLMLAMMTAQFQDYFAGPRLVGQMIDMHSVLYNQIGLTTFVNDFLGSVPFIANYINQSDRINFYFNIYNNVRNSTLIAPVLGTGYCYFPPFPFFFTILFEFLAIKFDSLMGSTTRISYRYLYAYMGYCCAMCMGYSTQNIFAVFVSTFIPLLILLKINDWVVFRLGNIQRLRSNPELVSRLT